MNKMSTKISNLLDNISYDEFGDECMLYNDVTDSSSCDSSLCCSSHFSGSIPEWETEIDDFNRLYYVKVTPLVDDVSFKSDNEKKTISKDKVENVMQGEMLRKFMRKRKCKSDKKGSLRHRQQNVNKVTFMDSQEGEEKEVILQISTNSLNLGRRSTLSENYLGLITSAFEDNKRIMIAGFVPNGLATNLKSIKIGDWLKAVNGTTVTASNLDAVLSNIKSSAEVKLLIQRVAVLNVEKNVPQNLAAGAIVKEPTITFNAFSKYPLGVACFDVGDATVNVDVNSTMKYCFPEDQDDNVVCSVEMALLTLYHTLPKITSNQQMRSSSILLQDQSVHLVYIEDWGYLTVIAVPDSLCSLFVLNQLSVMVMKYLKFCFVNLKRCISEESNRGYLNKFFEKLFTRIVTDDIKQLSVGKELPSNYFTNAFEDCFIYPPYISLSSNLQMKIDDILNDLESNDFGDLMLDSYGSQKSYIIVGSCLYHRGYQVLTHLNQEDQLDVHSYCYLEGLLNLTAHFVIHSLVIWREVFLSSFKNRLEFISSSRRWFLLIVGQGHSILVVLLEAGGCATVASNSAKPDNLYIQQTQEMLSLINGSGLTEAAAVELSSNMNPQIKFLSTSTAKTASYWKSTENLLNFMNNSPGSFKKSPEVTSILKHRGYLEKHASTHSSPVGETIIEGDSSDTASRTTSSMFSDEIGPVIGRREQRMKKSAMANPYRNSDSDYSDNDVQDNSPVNLLAESKRTNVPLLPTKLTSGKENILFYYLDVDIHRGVLICPPNANGNSGNYEMATGNITSILKNFHQTIQRIHLILNNTQCKKKFPETNQSVAKFRIPVKECGILFEYTVPNAKKQNPFVYWVVGRLFSKPSREVYVCYEDKIPQNMVEIAFMLATKTQ